MPNAKRWRGSDSDIETYLKDVQKTPLLTMEEERKLAKRIKKGDKLARDRFIRSNLRLVISIAKRYMGRGLPFSDLINEGNLGLMKAVERFDLKHRCRFSTYATWWIKQRITRAITDTGSMIRLPSNTVENILRVRNAMRDLGRPATPLEIQDICSVRAGSAQYIHRALGLYVCSPVSLHTTKDASSDGSLLNTLCDERALPADAHAEKTWAIEEMECALTRLAARSRQIIQMRYGLGGKDPKTLKAIGSWFDLSRERVRQIEAKALRDLRRILQGHNGNHRA